MSVRLLPVTLALILVPAVAQAQRQVAEEPTGGIDLPATPLAGEHDARATTANPAGLHFVPGFGLVVALDLARAEDATSGGPGFGAYVASAAGGGVLPRMGLGAGVEWLRPSRTRLLPDPGTPLRLTIAGSLGLGRRAALGLGWHHFYDDEPGSVLAGHGTWDLGLSLRFGNRFAAGAVVRDLSAPFLDDIPVQRRYELEWTTRPTGTDRLDLGIGGRIGERRADVDGWFRASARVVRGLYLHAAVESRELQIVETAPSGAERNYEDRDLRATLGIEVSFGALGITTYGTGAWDESGDAHPAGTVLVRLSTPQVPSLQGHSDRIERLEISGGIGVRNATKLALQLRAIAKDPAVRAVVITIDGVDAGWATIQELRNALLEVRAAGKKIYAYVVVASTREYFLASAANKVYIDPAGELRLTGFSATTLFFRGTFDKLGVSAQFEKIAEYKSFPESYTDLGPSAPALKMRDEMYDSLFEELVEGIAKARRLDRGAVEVLVRGGPYNAGTLNDDHRLIDAVAEPDRIAELIATDLGRLYPVATAPDERDERWERPAIAVIYADGDIIDGTSQTIPILDRKLVGGETMVNALRAARLDPRVKAVVIRIDSPGGSALASELMSREVFALRGVKPVICSMGDVAASGGYFLAAGCDYIFAEPMTITGSIGIFSGKFDVSGLLAKLGVATVTAKRGEHSDMESFYRPYTDDEREIIRNNLKYAYGRFTGAVAKGRGISEKEVDEVGRGRVWTGKMAKGIKLVDGMGGVVAAIDYAKQLAHLGVDERVDVIELPRISGSLLNFLLGSLAREHAREKATLDLPDLPGVRAVLHALPASLLVEPDSLQARLPFEITWE